MNKVLNIIIIIFIAILTIVDISLIVGILFDLENIEFFKDSTIVEKLTAYYRNDKFTIVSLLTALGGFIGFWLLYLRYIAMIKQADVQSENFHKETQFKNFLEATKMLTDKDSTIEAKISALYLLYDVAESHPENIERIIQVINKQLTPLIKCIENECDKNKYNKKIVEIKKDRQAKTNETTFEYTETNPIILDVNCRTFRQDIKEWKYRGNDKEKLISVSLEILKKIVLNIVLKENKHIDISNTVLFDIDSDFNTELKFISQKPTENIIFLSSKLKKTNFKNTKYHSAKFINCNLKSSNFSNANLWGTDFINCNLEDVNFQNTECEGVEFIKFKNLNKKQIESMSFKNSTDDKEYLLVLSEDNGETLDLEPNTYFKNRVEYKDWKNNQND